MDLLNDYNPIYPPNPETKSESDEEYIDKLLKRKRKLNFDDFCLVHSDDLWYLWCTIKEMTVYSGLLDRLDYPSFCSMCYENSDN